MVTALHMRGALLVLGAGAGAGWYYVRSVIRRCVEIQAW